MQEWVSVRVNGGIASKLHVPQCWPAENQPALERIGREFRWTHVSMSATFWSGRQQIT